MLAEPVPPPAPAPARPPPKHGLRYRNLDEAMEALDTDGIPHDYPVPPYDATFPQNPTDRAAYIRRLFDAFVDIDSCIDREDTDAFVTRWQGIPNNTSCYSRGDVETCCHLLLEMAMDLHTKGPRSLNIFDTGKLEQVHKYHGFTFAQRIDSICKLLRLSKVRCQLLLRFEGLEVAVGIPPLLVAQVRMNLKQNTKRRGAVGIAGGVNEEGSEENEDDGEYDTDFEAEGGLEIDLDDGLEHYPYGDLQDKKEDERKDEGAIKRAEGEGDKGEE